MELGKRRILINAFLNSQFNYCPVIWMCHSRALNNKINRLHERCLRIIYNHKTSTFKELQEKDNSVSIHNRKIQALSIEMYTVANGMDPEMMNEIFQLTEKSHYNLHYTTEFIIPLIHNVYHSRDSTSDLGNLQLWELIPTVIRQIDTLFGFKKAIKNWKPTDCSCRICKTYVPNVGFPEKQCCSLPCMCHFLVFLLRHINPSILVVAECHTCSSKEHVFYFILMFLLNFSSFSFFIGS